MKIIEKALYVAGIVCFAMGLGVKAASYGIEKRRLEEEERRRKSHRSIIRRLF